MVYPTGERDSWGWQVSHCTSSMTIFPRFESRPPKKGDCGINLTHHFSLPRHPSFILNAELWSAWRVERLQGLRRSLGNWDEEVSRTPTPQTTPRLLYFSIKHYRSHLDSVSGTGLRTGQALPRLLTQIYELATQSPFYTWESEVRAVTWTRNIDKQEQVDQGSGPGLPGPKAGTPRSPHGAPGSFLDSAHLLLSAPEGFISLAALGWQPKLPGWVRGCWTWQEMRVSHKTKASLEAEGRCGPEHQLT